MRLLPLLSLAALAVPVALHAQRFTTSACTDQHDGHSRQTWFSNSRDRFCEVRRTTLPLTNDRVAVLAKNGGIEITGEDRNDIALEARVDTQGASPAQAEALARQITITTAGTIEAHGPESSASNPGWAVSFRLLVPHRIAAELRTSNGGISLAALDGTLRADTTNGGLSLRDLAGDVHATTVNGGVDLTLAGTHWQGTGLDVRTTNGGIAARLPQPYNAHLDASTVNGRVAADFPVPAQGQLGKELNTNLGQGGAPLHLQTTNGGVALSNR